MLAVLPLLYLLGMGCLILPGGFDDSLEMFGALWPAPTTSGHIKRVRKVWRNECSTNGVSGGRLFFFASLFAVRNAFACCFLRLERSRDSQVATLGRWRGSQASSIAISSRYVHPSEDAVLSAMANLGRHNSAHRPKILKKPPTSESTEVTERKGEKWCARRDSNSRPIAPEAIALSI
jgi:hypothetical protein